MNGFLNRRWWNWFAWPALLTLTLYSFRRNGSVNPHDEGVWLAAAQCLIEGKRLYSDVWFQYGPLLLAPVKAAFAFFTPSLAVVRATFWFENLTGLLAVYFALIAFVKEPRARFVLSLFVFLVPTASHVPCIPMPARYGAGFLSVLFWPESALLAGAFAAVSYFISQETGIAVFLAGLFFFYANGNSKKFLAAFGAVFAAGLTWIAIRMELGAYLHCTLPGIATLVSDQRLAFPRLDLSLWRAAANGAVRWHVPFQNVADVGAAYSPTALYVAGLVYARRASIDRPRRTLLTALAVFGLLMLAPAYGRSDRWHIYIALSPLILFAGVWFETMRRVDAARADKFLLAVVVAGNLLFLPHFFAARQRDRALRRAGRVSAVPRAGAVMMPAAQANGFEFLAQWVEERTKPNEPVLFYPYNGAFYFLVDRPNPSTIPVLSYASRPEQQARVVEELRNPALNWIVWDKQNDAFDGKPVAAYFSVINAYLMENFERADGFGPFEFWKRKTAPAL